MKRFGSLKKRLNLWNSLFGGVFMNDYYVYHTRCIFRTRGLTNYLFLCGIPVEDIVKKYIGEDNKVLKEYKDYADTLEIFREDYKVATKDIKNYLKHLIDNNVKLDVSLENFGGPQYYVPLHNLWIADYDLGHYIFNGFLFYYDDLFILWSPYYLFNVRPFDDGRMIWNSNDGFQTKIPDIYDGAF